MRSADASGNTGPLRLPIFSTHMVWTVVGFRPMAGNGEVMSSPAPQLEQIAAGDRNELEVSTALVRRFLGIGDAEFCELTAFVRGRPWVAHIRTYDEHLRLLREAHSIRGFSGAYMLVNGPLDPALAARYTPAKWDSAWNGRAADDHIGSRRALFVDTDPVRPKGISSTDAQIREAWEVSNELETWLAQQIGTDSPIGHGCSGNGYFTLIALEAEPDPIASTARVARFLKLLNAKFATERIKVDVSVSNAARLMCCPGTWKRKGIDHPERPHRLTSFCCRPEVTRLRLGGLC
jgi:hypothetical protein